MASSGKKFIIFCNKLTILKVNHGEKNYCSFKISPFESYILCSLALGQKLERSLVEKNIPSTPTLSLVIVKRS